MLDTNVILQGIPVLQDLATVFALLGSHIYVHAFHMFLQVSLQL